MNAVVYKSKLDLWLLALFTCAIRAPARRCLWIGCASNMAPVAR